MSVVSGESNEPGEYDEVRGRGGIEGHLEERLQC